MIGQMPTSPLLIALAQARQRSAPMFTKWCELHGVSACPATPGDVARFVTDCAALGIGRLWPAVHEISKMHTSLGLADPTLGSVAAAAVDKVAGIVPPRAWPAEQKVRFKALPYDLQVFVTMHEAQREKAIRRAQNEAARAKQQLSAFHQKPNDATDDPKIEKVEVHECTAHTSS